MSDGILRPVYYRQAVKSSEKRTPVFARTGKGGVSSFLKLFSQHIYARIENGIAREYYYSLAEEEPTDSKPYSNADKQIPSHIVPSHAIRYELSAADLEKIKNIKYSLHWHLSPVLEKHGAEFWYQTGGAPNETPKYINGSIRWYVRERRDDLSRIAAGRMEYFRIEASVGRIVIADSSEVHGSLPYVSFIVQLKNPKTHADHFSIPSSGIGSDMFLEELFAVLEGTNFSELSLPDWKERLDWFCGMIDKHQNTIFKPLPRSLLKSVFHSIRSRAVKIAA